MNSVPLWKQDRAPFPTSDTNRALVDYLDGVEIIGGTGRFDGAKGNISSAFGGADLKLGQIILRYAGTVCFHPVAVSDPSVDGAIGLAVIGLIARGEYV